MPRLLAPQKLVHLQLHAHRCAVCEDPFGELARRDAAMHGREQHLAACGQRMLGNARAREYQSRKAELLSYVLDSFAKIRAQCDVVLVEGAGSASEVNLRANDIANMGFARAADVPILPVSFDYPSKTIAIGPLFHAGADMHADLVALHAYYAPFRGKHRNVG